jgi:hypothetical protein
MRDDTSFVNIASVIGERKTLAAAGCQLAHSICILHAAELHNCRIPDRLCEPSKSTAESMKPPRSHVPSKATAESPRSPRTHSCIIEIHSGGHEIPPIVVMHPLNSLRSTPTPPNSNMRIYLSGTVRRMLRMRNGRGFGGLFL